MINFIPKYKSYKSIATKLETLIGIQSKFNNTETLFSFEEIKILKQIIKAQFLPSIEVIALEYNDSIANKTKKSCIL